MNLNIKVFKFPIFEKDFGKIEKKNIICVNMFCYENELAYPIYVSDQKFEHCRDSLLIANENVSHCAYIKDFKKFMCNKTTCKTKCKIKTNFCRFCLQCFSSERVLAEH